MIAASAQPAALDAIAREHQAFLLALARKLCGHVEDPADLVQDVFEKAVRRPDRIPPDGARNWLVRVMRNTLIDRWRRRVAAPRPVELDERQAAQAPEPPAWWTALEVDDVRDCLAELPDDQREAFEQFAFERQSYQEIAARFGIPKTTVGTRILRARRRLRELLPRVPSCAGAEC